jgi:hypothetical protein
MSKANTIDFFNVIFNHALRSNGIPRLPGETPIEATIAWSLDRALLVSGASDQLSLLRTIISGIK